MQMYITFEQLIQFSMFVIALINLIIQVSKHFGNKKDNSDKKSKKN